MKRIFLADLNCSYYIQVCAYNSKGEGGKVSVLAMTETKKDVATFTSGFTFSTTMPSLSSRKANEWTIPLVITFSLIITVMLIFAVAIRTKLVPNCRRLFYRDRYDTRVEQHDSAFENKAYVLSTF